MESHNGQSNLADLDAFVAVARARSFRGAAAARGGSASGLSEAVRRLEAALGVRLLNRTTRSVTPTEAGERLLERLEPALGEIESGLDVVNSFRSSPRGTLKLNVPAIVAAKILPAGGRRRSAPVAVHQHRVRAPIGEIDDEADR
jgi:DNA-binding transcriptional LysR family regulator